MREDCGLDLFRDFTFEDIRRAKPPEAKGVYVIRVRKAGLPPGEILKELGSHPGYLPGEKVDTSILRQIRRIRNIGDCPVLYIGSAGTSRTSRHTLAGRYRDLTRRHTAQFPLWALLYFGWELDFGWKAAEDPREEEAGLKRRYLNRGRRSLPALVAR